MHERLWSLPLFPQFLLCSPVAVRAVGNQSCSPAAVRVMWVIRGALILRCDGHAKKGRISQLCPAVPHHRPLSGALQHISCHYCICARPFPISVHPVLLMLKIKSRQECGGAPSIPAHGKRCVCVCGGGGLNDSESSLVYTVRPSVMV